MASPRAVPNTAFRGQRGQRSPGEFAAAVRRAAREIGEQVACDARYIGRVEAGEIRCPNYAYERVFRHMFPGLDLADLGFSPRESVRGRAASKPAADTGAQAEPAPPVARTPGADEESDVRRRAFMTNSTASVASLGLGLGLVATPALAVPASRRIGEAEVSALEDAVRRVRLLDDRYGADGLYRRAEQPLRAAYALLDAGTVSHRSTSDQLHTGAGELAITVGWLAHDSGRFDDARSHYAEALATARFADDFALEAHAFCNMSFLARDAGRHREAVRAAQAGGRAARDLASPRLLSLLALREAGGRAGLGDRTGCERSLGLAHTLFGRGSSDADPEWMSFFGEPELWSLEAQCRAALGDWSQAARHAYRATTLQESHFARNLAVYRAELATDLAHAGFPNEAAAVGHQVLDLLEEVRSSRIQGMLAVLARGLLPRRHTAEVSGFLERHAALAATAHRISGIPRKL